MPLLLHLSLTFIAEQTSYDMEHPFGQFGPAVLAMSPLKILPTPSLLVGENVGETALMLFEHCLALAKTLVCYQHLPSYQYKAEQGGYGENELRLSQTQFVIFGEGRPWSVIELVLYLN